MIFSFGIVIFERKLLISLMIASNDSLASRKIKGYVLGRMNNTAIEAHQTYIDFVFSYFDSNKIAAFWVKAVYGEASSPSPSAFRPVSITKPSSKRLYYEFCCLGDAYVQQVR